MKALATTLACLGFTAAGCGGSGNSVEASNQGPDGKQRRLDSIRLKELDLTYAVPAQVREACTDARRFARVRVICPRLVPDVPLTTIEGLWGAMVSDPGFYELTFNNGGLPGGKRHWMTGGGKASVVEDSVLTNSRNEVKGDPKHVRTVEVGGRRVFVYRFPPFPAGGPHGGHSAAFVRVGDEMVFASLHGRRFVDAAVEMALALADDLDAGR